MICKNCVRYDMCSSLMLEFYTACALGIRGSCEYYEKAEQALRDEKAEQALREREQK